MFGGAELAGDDEEDDEIVAGSSEKKLSLPPWQEEVVEESEGESEDEKDEEFESANTSESGTGGVVAQRGVEMMDMKQIRAIVRDELRELLDEVKAERLQAAEERKADMERVRKANETAAANLKRDVTNATVTLLQQHSKENAKTLENGIGRAQSSAATSAQPYEINRWAGRRRRCSRANGNFRGTKDGTGV